jgi:hypothetical protein
MFKSYETGFLSVSFSFIGTNSLMTMVVIGYDRYNVIVKGFQGVKMNPGIAFIILISIWIYSTIGSLPPFIFGWGDYSLGMDFVLLYVVSHVYSCLRLTTKLTTFLKHVVTEIKKKIASKQNRPS